MAESYTQCEMPCECTDDETRFNSSGRSVSMSANIANTLRKDFKHSIANTERMLPKVTVRSTHSLMSSSTCSHILPLQDDNIVLGIIFSKWDDIMGPQTIHVWLKDDSTPQEFQNEHFVCHHEADSALMKSIKYVTGHSVNYMEVNTVSPITRSTSHVYNEHNTTLFVVPDLDLVAQAIVFHIRERDLDVPHALSMMVQYKHYEYYLSIRQLCRLWLQRIASRMHQLLVSGATILKREFVTYEGVNQWMCEFNTMLISLRTCRLNPLVYDQQVLNHAFIERAIISHLQTLGCTVVMGSSPNEINAFIEFLSLFLEKEELVCSRLVLPQHRYSFQMGLFLQGLLLDEYGGRELSPEELSSNPCPVSAIDLTRKGNVSSVKQSTLGMNSLMTWRHHSMLSTMKDGGSRLVRELLSDLRLLPTSQWPDFAKSFMYKIQALAQLLVNIIDSNGYV